MNLAFLLHLYQPPTQTEAAFRAITHECYTPLIKLIKSKSDFKITLNMPLSLLEQLDKYGYFELLSTIKELVETDRIELVGSAAYHPLLTKIPQDFAAKQIVLNEYGLGYYFGQRQGFEGEVSMMVKDLRGFFPPELAINADVIKTLDSLGYEWVVVDEPAIPKQDLEMFGRNSVFSMGDLAIKLVVRDTDLSNMLSFDRDDINQDVLDYVDRLKENNTGACVVVMDGEAFGHHNKEGIDLLTNVIDALAEKGIAVTTVSEAIQNETPNEASVINESTWAVMEPDENADIYPLWQNSKNKIQTSLWEILNLVLKDFATKTPPPVEEGYENMPIWKEKELQKLTDNSVHDFLTLTVLIQKCMHSDQFWWASNKTIYDELFYSPLMIKNALDIYKKISESTLMSESAEKVHRLSSEIEGQIEK